MARQFGLLGVPSSAGAHGPGPEQAPRYLRDGGIVERLRAAGVSVRDHGDLPLVRGEPDPVPEWPGSGAAVVTHDG